jgi:hypothetical protein
MAVSRDTMSTVDVDNWMVARCAIFRETLWYIKGISYMVYDTVDSH